MKLSKRLEMIASLVPEGSIPADIGTDHGFIPVWLVSRGICPRAYAMDVRKGPLERAGAHVKEYGLEDKITLRLSDGLRELAPGEADTVVIAGMGGQLICRILEEGRHVWDSTKQFILSPQSELAEVRKYLEQNGFWMLQEGMLKEEGKYYVVMAAEHHPVKDETVADGVSVPPDFLQISRECGYEYGRLLIQSKHPVLLEFLEKEKKVLSSILAALPDQASDSTRARKEQLQEKLDRIEEAEHEMQ